MIGERFSDNHPCIIEYNNNLIELYSQKADERERSKTVDISA